MAALEYPRWKFRYSRFKNDPRPDILLLGSYKNPSTGNTLIGGINLNYCTDKEINRLRTALDKFAAGKSLYQRYHIGRQLFPDIFTTKYRTYNANEIIGVNKDVIYPTMGVLQRISQFAKSAYNKLMGRKPEKQEIEDLKSIDPESYKEMQQDVKTPQEFDDKLNVAIDDIKDNAQVPTTTQQQTQKDQQAATDARLTAQMAQNQEQPADVTPSPATKVTPAPDAKTAAAPPTVPTKVSTAEPTTPVVTQAMQAPQTVESPSPIPELPETEPFEEPEESAAESEENETDLLDQSPQRSVIDQKIDQALSRGDKKGGNELGTPGA